MSKQEFFTHYLARLHSLTTRRIDSDNLFDVSSYPKRMNRCAEYRYFPLNRFTTENTKTVPSIQNLLHKAGQINGKNKFCFVLVLR